MITLSNHLTLLTTQQKKLGFGSPRQAPPEYATELLANLAYIPPREGWIIALGHPEGDKPVDRRPRHLGELIGIGELGVELPGRDGLGAGLPQERVGLLLGIPVHGARGAKGPAHHE